MVQQNKADDENEDGDEQLLLVRSSLIMYRYAMYFPTIHSIKEPANAYQHSDTLQDRAFQPRSPSSSHGSHCSTLLGKLHQEIQVLSSEHLTGVGSFMHW
jgi:hypothetical protein